MIRLPCGRLYMCVCKNIAVTYSAASSPIFGEVVNKYFKLRSVVAVNIYVACAGIISV